jgi:Tfp pilus assembly protein FimT
MLKHLRPTWAHARRALHTPLALPLQSRSIPRGQGMTEYIVVVAVVAVAAIGVYSMLGQTIRNQTAGIAQEIAGNDAGAALNAASSSAASARTQANVRKDLKNYNQDNH